MQKYWTKPIIWPLLIYLLMCLWARASIYIHISIHTNKCTYMFRRTHTIIYGQKLTEMTSQGYIILTQNYCFLYWKAKECLHWSQRAVTKSHHLAFNNSIRCTKLDRAAKYSSEDLHSESCTTLAPWPPVTWGLLITIRRTNGYVERDSLCLRGWNHDRAVRTSVV